MSSSEQRMIYRRDYRHKPMIRRRTEKQREESRWYAVAGRRWITAVRHRGCTCGTPTQRNQGRVIAEGAEKILHNMCICTRVPFVHVNISSERENAGVTIPQF